MGRKRKKLIFGDEESIARAKCSQRLPRSAVVDMIARVETETTPVGIKVSSIMPLDGKAFFALRRRDILPSKAERVDEDGKIHPLTQGATVYERDPMGFAPYTDLVYTDDEPRKFYLIHAVY